MLPNPQFPADLVIFTEEILNVKLHFLCSVTNYHNLSLYRLSSDPDENLKNKSLCQTLNLVIVTSK